MTAGTQPPTVPGSFRRRIFLALKLTVGVGLIAWLLASGRLDLFRVLGAVNASRDLTAGLICSGLAVILPIFRFQVLARLQRLPFRFSDSLRVSMIGNFFNVFIPGASGGDVIRAAYAVRWSPGRQAGAVALPFVDRGLGLHALLVLAVGAAVIDPDLYARHAGLFPWTILSAALLVGATVVPLILIRPKTGGLAVAALGRLIGSRTAWTDSLELYRQGPGRMAAAYGLSLAGAACNILALHFMVRAAGSSPQVIDSLAVAPLVIVANTLPISPGGIGVAEGVSAVLYAAAGTPGGADGMLLARAVVLAIAVCGLPFFLAGRRRAHELPPETRWMDSKSASGRKRI